jgi:hypothetical protein
LSELRAHLTARTSKLIRKRRITLEQIFRVAAYDSAIVQSTSEFNDNVLPRRSGRWRRTPRQLACFGTSDSRRAVVTMISRPGCRSIQSHSTTRLPTPQVHWRNGEISRILSSTLDPWSLHCETVDSLWRGASRIDPRARVQGECGPFFVFGPLTEPECTFSDRYRCRQIAGTVLPS